MSQFLQKIVFCFPMESGWKTTNKIKKNLNASRWDTFRVFAPLQQHQKMRKMLKFFRSCIQVFAFFLCTKMGKRKSPRAVPAKIGQNLKYYGEKFVLFDDFARFWECVSPNRIKYERFLIEPTMVFFISTEYSGWNNRSKLVYKWGGMWTLFELFCVFCWFSQFLKSCGARSSGDVVRRLLGTLWEMLRDALAVGAKSFGKTFGRWFDGLFVRFIGSFVRSRVERTIWEILFGS